MENPGKHRETEVEVRELIPVAKYRVRILENLKTHRRALDIREHLTTHSFDGYTRRGIRLTERSQVELLRDVLTEVLKSM